MVPTFVGLIGGSGGFCRLNRMSSQPELRRFPVPLSCFYLLDRGSASPGSAAFAVALHGYGQNPADMLELTRRALGPGPWIASVQGPHPFTLKPFQPNSGIGYNWGTPGAGWAESIQFHHKILVELLFDLARFGAEPQRTVLVGFSQPVGLNYRFIRAHPTLVGGVIGVCGGVPRDWEELPLPNATAAVLHIARDQDEYYPVERVTQFAERLKSRCSGEVEFHLLPGPHRFPSQASGLIQDWVGRIRS